VETGISQVINRVFNIIDGEFNEINFGVVFFVEFLAAVKTSVIETSVVPLETILFAVETEAI
jgi:hypothetical protein